MTTLRGFFKELNDNNASVFLTDAQADAVRLFIGTDPSEPSHAPLPDAPGSDAICSIVCSAISRQWHGVLGIIREVDARMAKGPAERDSDDEIYRNIFEKYKDEFQRLFSGQKCRSAIFRRYQHDKECLDECQGAKLLDFTAMTQSSHWSRHKEALANGGICKNPVGIRSKGRTATNKGTNSSASPIGMHGACLDTDSKPTTNDPILAKIGFDSQLADKEDKYAKYFKCMRLNEIQERCLRCIDQNDSNLLLSAPTGSGKTLVAVMGMIKCLEATKTARIFYIAPIKALIREKIEEISKTINYDGSPSPFRIIGVSSDTDVQMSAIKDAHVCIGTAERLDMLLRNELVYDLIVIDEIHLLNSNGGGAIEAVVSRTSSRIIAMSATIPNAEDVRLFLKVPKHNCLHFGEEHRPVPIRYECHAAEACEASERVVVARAAAEPGPLILFVNERKTTLRLAQQIAARLLSVPLNEEDMKMADKIKDHSLFAMISKGVCIHHAGLAKDDRSVIEGLFKQGAIRVLVSTTTLAWGMNMPCRAVIVYGWFESLEIIQLCGRAGRAAGAAPALGCFYGPGPDKIRKIESRLLESIEFHLNAEICRGAVRSLAEAIAWFERTFYYQRLLSASTGNRQQKNVDDATKNAAEKRLQARCIVYTAIKNLEQQNLVKNFVPTLMGTLSHRYYLKPAELKAFATVNKFYNEALVFDLLEGIVKCPDVSLPGIDVPFPTKSETSMVLQFILGGCKFPIDIKEFLQNVSRIYRGLFEYCLARHFAIAARVLKICGVVEQQRLAVSARSCHTDAFYGDAQKIDRNRISTDIKNDNVSELHFCAAWCCQPHCILAFAVPKMAYDDIKFIAEAARLNGIVRVSIRLERLGCVRGESILVFITDSMNLDLLSFRSLEADSPDTMEFYLENARDRFLNIRLAAYNGSAELFEKITVIPAEATRPTAYDPACDTFHLSYPVVRAVPEISFDLTVVLSNNHKPYSKVCTQEFMTYESFCELLYAACDAVPPMQKGLAAKLRRKDAKVFLTSVQLRDEIYVIKAVIYKCLVDGINAICLADGPASQDALWFSIIDAPLRAHATGGCFLQLFDNLDACEEMKDQLVIFESERVARQHCCAYKSKRGRDAVFTNDLNSKSGILFSTSKNISRRFHQIHMVSSRTGYFSVLRLFGFCDSVVVYTSSFQAASIRAEAQLYSEDGICLRNVLAMCNMKNLPEELGYYTGVGLLRYPEYRHIVLKYTLKAKRLEALHASLKNCIGIKSALRMALEIHCDSHRDSAEVRGAVEHLIANNFCGGPAPEAAVLKRSLMCIVELCCARKFFKAIVACIYAMQKIAGNGKCLLKIARETEQGSIVLEIQEIVHESATLFFIDELFNFKMVEFYEKGTHVVVWPGEVYIACDCFGGIEKY